MAVVLAPTDEAFGSPEPDHRVAPQPLPATEPSTSLPQSDSRDDLVVTPRRGLAVMSLLITVASLLQHPGKMIAETKLPLSVDPGLFLSRITSLWDPSAYGGQIQNAAGYVFPMGGFFWVGNAIGLPAWIIQRLWIAALLIVAAWSMARFCDALRVGSPRTRLIGAAAYAASPFFLGRIGVLSAWVIGGAILPAMLIPLVRYFDGDERWSARRAGLTSALLVGATGGINATVTLVIAVAPLMWIISQSGWKHRIAVLKYWVLGLIGACAWWLVPMYFQSRYGFEFFNYTEQAHRTTSTVSATEVLRGTSDWLGYLNIRRAWLPAGHLLTVDRVLIAASTLLVAFGLRGLADRNLPRRKQLVALLGVGATIIGAGYWGSLGGPFSGATRWLLDGPLEGFRNVFKFQPLVTFPLTIGFVQSMSILRASRTEWVKRWGIVIHVVIVAALLTPMIGGGVANSDGFDDIPDYWREAAAWIDQQPPTGRTLLLPGSALPNYNWGFTLDEPALALFRSPWMIRNQAPTGSEGATRVADAIEQMIERGGSADLAAYLRRSGISRIVVRNDLDWKRWFSPRPAAVRVVLERSGLHRMKEFGPTLGESGMQLDAFSGANELDFHALDVYSVTDADVRVTMPPVAGTIVASGSTEATASLIESGMTDDQAVVIANDLDSTDDAVYKSSPKFVATDTYRRQYTEFGLDRTNDSYALTPDEVVPGTNGAQDFSAHDPAAQSVAEMTGVKAVTASSYGSWLLQIPEFAPFKAIDGSMDTQWVAGNGEKSQGEWWEVELLEPRELARTTIKILNDGPYRAFPSSLKITTDTGERTIALQQGQAVVEVDPPAGATSHFRIEFASIYNDAPNRPSAGLQEVEIPGVTMNRTLHAAPLRYETVSGTTAATNVSGYVFDRVRGNQQSILRQDPELELDRTFDVPASTKLSIEATAAPVASEPFTRRISKGPITVSASSTFGNQPSSAPINLFDHDLTTFWLPDPVFRPKQSSLDDAVVEARFTGRSQPWVTFTWDTPATIDNITLRGGDSTFAGIVTIESSGGNRVASPDANGKLTFASITTRAITLRFSPTEPVPVRNDIDGVVDSSLAVSLSEIEIPQLQKLGTNDASPFVIPCEAGPRLTFDDKVTIAFSASTTVSDAKALLPLQLTPCGGSAVQLSPGSHHIRSDSNKSGISIAHLTMAQEGDGAEQPTARTFEVTDWHDESRTLEVQSGPMSFVSIAESYNTGWEAELNGRPLRSIKLDGWKQGFVVPAGDAGTIAITFSPGTTLRWGYGAAALALALALIMAARSRKDRRPTEDEATPDRPTSVVGSFVATVLVSLILGGWTVIAAVGVWFIIRFTRIKPAMIIFPSMIIATISLLIRPGAQPDSHAGTFSWVAQFFTVLSVAAVLALHQRRTSEATDDSVIDLREPAPTPSTTPVTHMPALIPSGDHPTDFGWIDAGFDPVPDIVPPQWHGIDLHGPKVERSYWETDEHAAVETFPSPSDFWPPESVHQRLDQYRKTATPTEPIQSVDTDGPSSFAAVAPSDPISSATPPDEPTLSAAAVEEEQDPDDPFGLLSGPKKRGRKRR